MNIFYLSQDPRICAEYHNDKHVVKMILEYAQLMSTAHRVLDGTLIDSVSASGRKVKKYLLDDSRDKTLYSATHVNHPSAIWVRASEKNYDWLYVMWRELMSEYKHRYLRSHACEKLIIPLRRIPYKIPKDVPFTPPTPAMPDIYKVQGDSLKSYHNYYNGAKVHLAKWKERSIPPWFNPSSDK